MFSPIAFRAVEREEKVLLMLGWLVVVGSTPPGQDYPGAAYIYSRAVYRIVALWATEKIKASVKRRVSPLMIIIFDHEMMMICVSSDNGGGEEIWKSGTRKLFQAHLRVLSIRGDTPSPSSRIYIHIARALPDE